MPELTPWNPKSVPWFFLFRSTLDRLKKSCFGKSYRSFCSCNPLATILKSTVYMCFILFVLYSVCLLATIWTIHCWTRLSLTTRASMDVSIMIQVARTARQSGFLPTITKTSGFLLYFALVSNISMATPSSTLPMMHGMPNLLMFESHSIVNTTEVKRRGEIFDIRPRPKPGQWKMERLICWFLDRLIQTFVQVEFFKTEVGEVTATLEEVLHIAMPEKIGAYCLWVRT